MTFLIFQICSAKKAHRIQQKLFVMGSFFVWLCVNYFSACRNGDGTPRDKFAASHNGVLYGCLKSGTAWNLHFQNSNAFYVVCFYYFRKLFRIIYGKLKRKNISKTNISCVRAV